MALDSTGHFSAASFERLTALYRLSVRLQEAGDETGIFGVLDEGLRQLGLTSFVGRYEAESQTIQVSATASVALPGLPGAGPRASEPRPVGATAVVERAIRAHEQSVLSDAAELAELLPVAGRTAAERRRGLQALGSAVVVPMVVRGRTSGVLFVLGSGLDSHQATLLRELAGHLAVALDAAAILRDLRQALLREHTAAGQLRRLEALVAELSADRDSQSALRRMANAIAEALEVGRMVVFLAEEGRAELVAGTMLGVELELASGIGGLLGDGERFPLAQILASGASAVVPDVGADPTWGALSEAAVAAGIRSAWFVPLISREGEPLGVLAILPETVGAPTPERLELAERYARHAARAITAGRQQERETLAARTEALADLARSIPHELGQPLAIIAGYAELIAVGRLRGEGLRDACRELVAASNNLAELVQRLERITSYATKEYGAGRVVIDLERAAAEEPPGEPSTEEGPRTE